MSDSPRLLITAGPTHEPIDAVRYLANRSSGRMGIALAEAAASRSLPVTLLLGPTQLLPRESSHMSLVRFQTTADLHALLKEHWPNHDVLIMAAAVADYRPKPVQGKLRRTSAAMTLELEPTPDLLASLAATTRQDQRVIGFALEPQEHLLASAKQKMDRKRLDAIVANPLDTMDAPAVTAALLLRDGTQLEAARDLSKASFANWLLDQLPRVLANRATS